MQFPVARLKIQPLDLYNIDKTLGEIDAITNNAIQLICLIDSGLM